MAETVVEKRARERRNYAVHAAVARKARKARNAADNTYRAGWVLPGRCAGCSAPVGLRLSPFRWVDRGSDDRHQCRTVRGGRAA